MPNCTDCKHLYVEDIYCEFCCDKGNGLHYDADGCFIDEAECGDFLEYSEEEDSHEE